MINFNRINVSYIMNLALTILHSKLILKNEKKGFSMQKFKDFFTMIYRLHEEIIF